MASATDSTSNEERDLRLKWSGRWTLAHRILTLNLITVLLVALSTLYLDVFRNHLSRERVRQTRIEATATALAIEAAGPEDRAAILAKVSKSTGSRLRLCFASPSHEQIREGVAVLAEVCRKEFGVPERSANVEKRART